MDNEIPVLELHRTASFRSLDNATGNPIFSNSSATNDKVSPASASPANSGANSGPAAPTLPVASRSNVTNIFPYGNVPLSLLQQQIPADIKVANRRPSFYQWPFVGASHAANFLFGNHGNQVRARLKSLGGGRKQEPNLQLTPPSLQNSVATKDAPTTPPGPRRPYFRRNQGQQLSIDEQNRAQYFLMRQQQLHLQQQQQLQQARQQPAAVNPSAVYSNQQPNLGIQFGPQVAAGALPQPVMHLQSPNNQRGYLAQPSGFQWRPENAFNNPAIRFPLSPALKADPTVSMPLDHMQQTFAQTLLSQNNQQHTESAAPSVRNQPQLPFSANPPAQPGGPVIIIASSIPLTGDDLVAVTPALATAYPTTSSSLPPSTSVATVTTMTILNTPQHSASSSTVAASDVVTVSSTRTVPKLTESTDGELHESESVQTALTTNSKGVGTEAEAAEVVAQLATKSAGNRETGNVPSVPSINLKPPPVEERPVVYVPVEEVPVLVDPAGFLNATITSAVDPINGKSDDDVERLPYALPANPSMPAPPWTLFADNERTEVPPFVRYDFTNNGDVGGFLPEELYPNPQQLGQARDQYWATPRARRINNPTVGLYPVIQQFLTQPPPPPPPQSFAVAGGSASAGAAKWEDVNKPRYIPLNPVDRQNRQLRMQYYVDTSNKPAELHTTTSTSVL